HGDARPAGVSQQRADPAPRQPPDALARAEPRLRRMSGAISTRGVSKTYDAEGGSVEALRECSFEVHAEEFVAIVGPSGCGKTTLLNAIAGFDTVSAGEIILDGALLAAPGRAPRPGPDRVVVFQHGALFPWKTVLDNVTYGPLKQRVLSRGAAQAKALERLRASGGLDTVAASYPGQLSSGMQRRVEIVRALMNDPRLLLLDEPFRAMDGFSKATMHQHLLDRKSTRLNSSHLGISYAVFCLKKKKLISKKT